MKIYTVEFFKAWFVTMFLIFFIAISLVLTGISLIILTTTGIISVAGSVTTGAIATVIIIRKFFSRF